MKKSTSNPQEMFKDLLDHPNRQPFGFGAKSALINVDLQCAYTRTDRYATAYADDPQQFDRVNFLVRKHRERNWPVVWTTLSYMDDGSDCGVWGLRSDTPDSLQRIGFDSDRARIDDRMDFEPTRDMHLNKKMPSAFHGTNLLPYLIFKRVDTVIVTGGSTSGCVRATVVDSLSNGFRTLVAMDCVADVHESPHFANLYDMQAKYADVLTADVIATFMDGVK